MQYSTTLQTPTIDKLVLAGFDYKFTNTDTKFCKQVLTTADGRDTVKWFYNSAAFSVDIKRDKAGRNCFLLKANPNKVPILEVMKELKAAGLWFNLFDSRVYRLDIERHKRLNLPLGMYHDIIRNSTKGNIEVRSVKDTITVATKLHELCLYDKSKQAKLSENGICRLETRFKKPAPLVENGVKTFYDLEVGGLDLLHGLYVRSFDKFLAKLHTLAGTEHDLFYNMVATLEQMYEVSNRPVMEFLALHGLGYVGQDMILNIIAQANIPKDKKSKAKKLVSELMGKYGSAAGGSKLQDMVNELLEFRQAA